MIDKIGDSGGLFDLVVRPMFQQGHEGELCSWLKEFSLIRTTLGCQQPECQGKILAWNTARVIDRYTWVCPTCSKKQSIREGSFFMGVKGDFRTCLQLILAWCQDIPSDIAANNFEIKEHVIKKVYERCSQVAEFYVNSHPEDFKLGGPGCVVLVDEFPSGYMTDITPDVTTTRKRNNNSQPILCIAEASHLPPRMWLHIIKALPEPPKIKMINNNNIINNNINNISKAIKQIVNQVLPGSYIVANSRARCCNYEALQDLKQYGVFSVEHLQKFDTPDTHKLLNNLATIWQTGLGVCEEIQESTRGAAKQIITNHLWRQRYGSIPSVAFQNMLNHIVECYRFT
ncbi:GSCOCG00007801001-RA-CDS [Cotesia congregata]|nr:GSCOCG00007801001-RA-CDS [Cotesia congregata]